MIIGLKILFKIVISLYQWNFNKLFYRNYIIDENIIGAPKKQNYFWFPIKMTIFQILR